MSVSHIFYTIGIAVTIIVGLPSHAVGADLSNEEYTLLSVVLEHGIGSDADLLLIDDRTTSGSLALIGRERVLSDIALELETSEDVLAAWQAANKQPYLLQEKLTISAGYRFIDARERAEFFDRPNTSQSDPILGWQRLREKYPNAIGIVRISRPGFDATNTRAGVYVEFECGANCGSGRFVEVARNSPDGWQVSGGSLVWIAAD